MSLSPSPVSLSNDTSTLRSRDDLRASTVEAIVAVIDIPALFGDGSSPVNASEVERGLKDLMNDSCRAAMGEYIEGLDDGRPTLLRDGEIWTRVPKTHNTIMTLFGPVTYVRHRYRRADSPSLVPVDEQLGLAMDYFTEPAGELAVLLYSQLPARTCSDLCRRIGGMALTESTLQRLARGAVETWDEVSQDALEEIRDEEGIPQGAVGASVSLDGVMVPMREERNGSLTTSYREASCGTLTWFDREGEALRTVATGRMPEAHKLTLKAQLEDELAHLAKAAPHISAIAIADGAKDNWTFLETVSDHCLVDYWHACQHLAKAKDAIGDKGKTWYARHNAILRNDFDGADRVIRSLRHYRRTATRFRGGRDLARGADVLRKQPPPHELPAMAHIGSSDRIGCRGSGEQDPGDKASQALGPALAPRGRPGGVDLAITLSVGPLRCRLETCHGEIEIHCRSAVSKRQR